jgi:hypothetical protein
MLPWSSSVTVDEFMAKSPGKPTSSAAEKKEIHELVMRLLKRFGNNKSAMGRALGLSQPTITAWVKQVNTPHHTHVRAMRKLLGEELQEARDFVDSVQSDTHRSLDAAWNYWASQNRWPIEVLAIARRLADAGAAHDPQGWTIRLDEISLRLASRLLKR